MNAAYSTELQRVEADYGWSASFTERSGVLRPTTVTTPPTAYSDDQLDRLEAGSRGWWYEVRNRIIEDTLRRHAPFGAIWDVGSGTGAVARYLRDAGREVVAVEPGDGGALVSARGGVTSIQSDLQSLGLPSDSLHVVGMFDVLEHLDDRPAVLAEIRRVLCADGRLILTLPALTMLWSDHDDSGGHHIRYSRRVIRRELREAGFVVERAGYCFLSAVLPLLLIRAIPYRLGLRQPVKEETMLASDGGPIGRVVGAIERRIALRAPVGTSLVVVARPSD